MYMVLPVLSPYAQNLAGATTVLTGLALGSYGLTQALFQLPFGFMSDRLGRKPTIVAGLLLFSAGSGLCALATSAWVLVLGRFVQGMGAIASTVVALVADLTRVEVRAQAMARLGIWVGGAFGFGMLVGPFLASWLGIPPLFWATAAASTVAAGALLVAIPAPSRKPPARVSGAAILEMLRQPPLLLLDVGSFLLHLMLTAIFVILPVGFESSLGADRLWWVVVPAVAAGLVAMVAIAGFADRHGRHREVLLSGAALLGFAALGLLIFGGSLAGQAVFLLVFILAVACLEPSLPALATRFADEAHRGAAMGGFHMAQFLGSFSGGLLGGLFLGGDPRVFWAICGLAGSAWGIGVRSVVQAESPPRAGDPLTR